MSDERLRNLRRAASQGDELALARLGIEPTVTASGALVDVHEGLRIQLPDGVDPSKAIIAGATQYDTHATCRRKWWFLWGVKLPKVQADFFTFGTVLHAAAERYELADDLGRDSNGQVLNLWPEGWDKDITKADADLIQRLIHAGIDAGLIGRRQGRQVEHPFLTPIGEHRGMHMFISGKIDLLFVEDAEIEDHKTGKNIKYAKSPKALAKTIQMRTYGKELQTLRAARGLPLADHVKVRHNFFCKDRENPAVRITESYISAQDIEDQHEKNVAASRDMVDLKLTFTDPNDWYRIPDPPNTVGACMAYGGCQFMTICGGRERADEYINRVQATLDQQATQETFTMTATASPFAGALAAQKKSAPAINGDVPSQQPADDATFAVVLAPGQKSVWKTGKEIRELLGSNGVVLDAKALLKGTTAWGTLATFGFQVPVAEPEAPPEEPQPPADETPPEAPQVQQQPPAPWAHAGCTACSTGPNPGFTPQGNPCRICDSTRAQLKLPTSVDFEKVTDGSGAITWRAKAPVSPATPAAGTTPIPQGDKPVAQKKTQRAATPPAADAPPPSPDAPAAGTTPKVRAAGRPRVTFRLYINCMPVGEDVIDVREIVKVYGAKLAENAAASGDERAKQGYFAMDFFQRRDSLSNYAEQIATDLEGKHVVAVCGAAPSDVKAVVDAIRGYASHVTMGLVA